MRIAAIFLLLVTPCLTARGAADPPPDMPVEVYLTLEQALRVVFSAGERIEMTELWLSAEEQERIARKVGRRLFEPGFRVYRGKDAADRIRGYAIVTEEIGKFQPITFVVGVTPKITVKRVAVMVYRESHGADVKRRRFLAQLDGRSTRDPIRLNRDIINISGATLSVRAVSRGTRKVLHTVDQCLLGRNARQDLAWRPFPAATAPAPIPSEKQTRKQARYLMGTLLEIRCHGVGVEVEAAMNDAFDEVARLEALMSTYRDDSELSRVNREGASQPVEVSRDTLECVRAALAVARQSHGAFDPTLTAHGHLDVRVDVARSTIAFLREGLRLDLGGIAKGYALDQAARVLESRGVTRALLNFGGQVLALDAPPDRDGWIVAIRDPRDPEELIGYYSVRRASVSTSAAYERGRHIVDPRDGASRLSTLSATVWAPTATAADGLSTALDVLGAAHAEELIRDIHGAAAVVVREADADPHVATTPGAPRFVTVKRAVTAR